HEPAHDLVDRGEQVVQVAGGVGRLRDLVGGELDLLGAPAVGDVPEHPDATGGLAGDPLGLRVALVDPAVLEQEDVEARRLGEMAAANHTSRPSICRLYSACTVSRAARARRMYPRNLSALSWSKTSCSLRPISSGAGR